MIYLNILLIGIGGFFGANGRYIIGKIALKITTRFPLGTLLVNIIGSYILGIFSILLIKTYDVNPLIRNMLMTGFCGSFTTFSSFSLDTYYLLERSKIKGFVNILLNVLLSLTAFFFGMRLL